MVIFKAISTLHGQIKGEFPGTKYGLSDKGWINTELFEAWLSELFLQYAVSALPLLLLLDGHTTHYQPQTVRLAKEHDVLMLCLPPHTTHVYLVLPTFLTPTSPKTLPRAHLLTSAECLAQLEEKKRQKQLAAEEKKQRKKERNKKRAMREQEQKRKAEERAKKAEERARKAKEMAEKKVKKVAEKTTRKVAEKTTRKAAEETNSTPNIGGEAGPGRLQRRRPGRQQRRQTPHLTLEEKQDQAVNRVMNQSQRNDT